MKNLLNKLLDVLRSEVPFYLFVIILPISALVGYKVHPNQKAETNLSNNHTESVTSMRQIRTGKYKFTRPLILTDVRAEDERFTAIKSDVNQYISNKIGVGVLKTASVYLRSLYDGSWMGINEEEHYSPGSLLKVPLLISYLKAIKSNPALANQKILFEKHFTTPRSPIFVSKGLVPGTAYTVEELLRYMTVYSDNDATVLLDSFLSTDRSDEVYTDLGLPTPSKTGVDYSITVQESARFLRVLFNATYLGPDMSDYGLRLLSESDFHEGIAKYIDGSVSIPRKFAERGDEKGMEFHEVGIVYLNSGPYLLGVMTRGKDLKELSGVVADISKIVYDEMPQAIKAF